MGINCSSKMAASRLKHSVFCSAVKLLHGPLNASSAYLTASSMSSAPAIGMPSMTTLLSLGFLSEYVSSDRASTYSPFRYSLLNLSGDKSMLECSPMMYAVEWICHNRIYGRWRKFIQTVTSPRPFVIQQHVQVDVEVHAKCNPSPPFSFMFSWVRVEICCHTQTRRKGVTSL